MMEQAYFIFNNISSVDYLMVNKLPNIIKAEKDIEKIEVVGRDGFLTEDNGSYKGIIKTVECTIFDLKDINFICSWLDGSSDVIFSNEPDKIYKATIINQIPFEKVAVQFHSFIIQFDCQPHKYAVTNDLITLTSNGTIVNTGTAPSNPIIKVFGSDTINLTINSKTIVLTNVVDYVTIDSDLMDCYKDTVLKNNFMSGDLPQLIVGNNTFSWSGTVTKIEVTGNFRYL